MGDLVHLLPEPEGAAELEGGDRADKVHTALAELTEERVVRWDLDGEAGRVEELLAGRFGPVRVTAEDTRGLLNTEPGDRGEGHVVVNELPPLHYVVRF